MFLWSKSIVKNWIFIYLIWLLFIFVVANISIFITDLRILFYSEKNRRRHANDFRLALFAHVICLILKGSKVIINECDTRRGQCLLLYKSVSLALRQNKKNRPRRLDIIRWWKDVVWTILIITINFLFFILLCLFLHP